MLILPPQFADQRVRKTTSEGKNMGAWGDKPWESDGALDFASTPMTTVLDAIESVVDGEKITSKKITFQSAHAVERTIAAADLLCRVYDYSDLKRAEKLAASLLPTLDAAIRYLRAQELSCEEANAIQQRLLKLT
jgi:hypothetical protein